MLAELWRWMYQFGVYSSEFSNDCFLMHSFFVFLNRKFHSQILKFDGEGGWTLRYLTENNTVDEVKFVSLNK